jgi:glycerophosphoryl diester phosphodiesterase
MHLYADLMVSFDRTFAIRSGLALLLAALNLNCVAQATQLSSVDVNHLIQLERPVVIAHRGYSQMAPENTLPAFRLALLSGADLVELDYHHSLDGVPVVLHDATLDRTTDARTRWNNTNIAIASRTSSDLTELDAGSWFDPLYRDVRLPLLTEALDLIQASSVTLIERKAGDAPTLIRLLRDRELLDRVVVQAFDWDFVQHCRELAPNLVLGALGPPASRDGRQLNDSEKWLNSAYLDEVQATGAQLVVWNRQVTPLSLAEANRRGLPVWVYTINEPTTAAVLVGLGVNGIITDNPALIWKGLATIPAPPNP